MALLDSFSMTGAVVYERLFTAHSTVPVLMAKAHLHGVEGAGSLQKDVTRERFCGGI